MAMQKNQMAAVKKRKNQLIKTKPAAYTILPNTEDFGTTFTQGAGVTAEVIITLPSAKVGAWYKFIVGSAQNLTILPGLTTDTIALPSTGAQGTANISIEANAIGESVELECFVEGDWNCNNYIGTWIATT